MNNLLEICTSLIFFSSGNGQIVQYAGRYRNFSVESETSSAFLFSSNIYQDGQDHKLSAAVNITKDIRMKSLDIITNRCSYEKSDCENFQSWKFTTTNRMKSIIYMKDQLWSPIMEHIKPKIDVPTIKKNIYQSKEIYMNTKMAVSFYPEIVNYYWRMETIVNDHNDRKALKMTFEGAIVPLANRNRTRVRGSTRTTKPK